MYMLYKKSTGRVVKMFRTFKEMNFYWKTQTRDFDLVWDYVEVYANV